MSPSEVPHDLAHPELRAALPDLIARDPEFPGGPDHIITPEETLALLPLLRSRWVLDASHMADMARSAPVETRLVPGAPGDPAVKVFVVDCTAPGRRPAILHMHGGGFIVGRAEDYLPALQAQALALDCVIVSVDYRLAPEHPFPAPVEDGYAALTWLWSNSVNLGVDRARIAVQGESAGGGLAAMIAIAARDRGEVPVMFQALTYPMLDDRTGSTHPVPLPSGAWCWTAKYNRMGWSALLGQPAGSPNVPAGSVPARQVDLGGLPPAFIWVGALDLFLFEDMDYSRRLALCGIPVELHVLPGVYHGFDGAAPEAAVTIDCKMTLIAALARAFGTVPAPHTKALLPPRSRSEMVPTDPQPPVANGSQHAFIRVNGIRYYIDIIK